MKLFQVKFDPSFLMLFLAFGFGLAVSSSGCVESETDSVSINSPVVIGATNEESTRDSAQKPNGLSNS